MTTAGDPMGLAIAQLCRDIEDLRQRLEAEGRALDDLLGRGWRALADLTEAPEPTTPVWPSEPVILVTDLDDGTRWGPLPVYAIRDDNGDYQLLDGTVLWQEDHPIKAWEPLYRLDDVLSYADLASLPEGARVRGLDGSTWTRTETPAWVCGTDRRPSACDLLIERGPLTLVHNPGWGGQ